LEPSPFTTGRRSEQHYTPKIVHWVVNDSEEPFRLFVVKLNYFREDTVGLE